MVRERRSFYFTLHDISRNFAGCQRMACLSFLQLAFRRQ
jgi:hypothetical protein